MDEFDRYLKEKQNNKKILIFLFIFLLISFFISFRIGRYPISIKDVIKVFLSRILNVKIDSKLVNIVLLIRGPRILAAILIGSALSLSGAVYQSLFRNPLVSPDILGVSAASAFGAAVSIFFSFSNIMTTIFSFLCGLIGMSISYIISKRYRGDRLLGLILSGIMVGSFFSALTSFLKLVADTENTLPAITYWLMGSLSAIRSFKILSFFIPLALGIIIIYFIRWRLNLFSIGDEEAQTLGINIKILRLISILCATLMTATAVSMSGLIGWVGLVVPHMARFITGEDTRYLVPTSLIIGSIFLLWIDNIARSFYTMEIPIGILTSFLGVPFYLYLLGRKS